MQSGDSTSPALDRALDAAGATSFILDVNDRSIVWSEGAGAVFDAPPRSYGAWLARLGPHARRRLRAGLRHATRTETVLDLVLSLDERDPKGPRLRIRAAIEPQFDGRVLGLVLRDDAAQPRGALGDEVPMLSSEPPVDARAALAATSGPAVFDPVALIAEAGRQAWPRARDQRVELIIDVPGEIPRLALGDPDRLRATLDRSLDDALGHCDAGWVEVRARHDAVGERLELWVEDTGSPGLGSGDLLGHRVGIALPCPRIESSANGPRYAVDGHGRHALVVCEKRRTAEILTARLREVGLHITALSDTVAATRTFTAVERLDLVVIEPEIEGVDTAELVACWRAARPGVPVLLARRPFHVQSDDGPALEFPWTAQSVAESIAPWFAGAAPARRARPVGA